MDSDSDISDNIKSTVSSDMSDCNVSRDSNASCDSRDSSYSSEGVTAVKVTTLVTVRAQRIMKCTGNIQNKRTA